MERARGLRPQQKQMFYQLMLTMFVAGVVSYSLHRPELLFPMLVCSWAISIFSFELPGYARITRVVLTLGILCYLMYRVVFHAA